MLSGLAHDRAERTSQGSLAGLALAMLLSSLATSIANVALPALSRAFEASFQEVQWVVLSYLLAVTALVVGAGRLGDLVGAKRLLLVGIGIFSAASLFCASAVNLDMLIAGRALQGVGAAIMMTLAMALAVAANPNAKVGAAMGLMGTMSAIGTALGPSLGGVLLHAWGWPSIFLVSVPFSLLAMGLAWRLVPDDAARPAGKRARFDLLGTILLALTLGAYALAMTIGRENFGLQNAALLGVAGLLLAAFVTSQSRSASPLIRLSMLGAPTLRAGLAASMLVAAVMMATLIIGPFYLAAAFGLDARLVGLTMSVGPLVAALAGVPAGRLVDRLGARRVMMLGLGGIATGAIALSTMPVSFGLIGYLGPIALMTTAYSAFQAANNSALIANAGANERGVVSALLTLSRNLGLITGSALLGAIFAATSGLSDVATLNAEAATNGLRFTFAAAAALIFIATFLVARSARIAGQRA